MTPPSLRPAILVLMIVCSSCSDDSARTVYQERISAADQHNDEALSIFKADRRAQAYVSKVLKNAESDTIPEWHVTPDISYASKGQPWYCPDEYVVESSDSTDANHNAIPWFQVNIRNSKVIALMSQREIDEQNAAHNYAEDDNRIESCLDGKNPVRLDPELLSDGS